MLTQIIHRLNAERTNLPGQARLWIAIILIPLPMFAIAFVAQGATEGMEFFMSVIFFWLSFSVFAFVVVYVLKMVFSTVLWVWDGFSVRTKNILVKMTNPVLKTGAFVLLVAVMAIYFRYDVAALGSSNGRYYDYVVWDRWSGMVYANTQLYNPKDRHPNLSPVSRDSIAALSVSPAQAVSPEERLAR